MSLAALFDVPAPAKLNLFLHVLGRRADGYHLLQSAFVLIDWCDTLHFETRRDGQLSRTDLGPALPADDLCLRAARLLQHQSGCALGAHISIDKQVPWGAGLGGGSSDAASTLLALNRLWGLHWPRERLLALALQIGADVPFFVRGHNAWVEGIGEVITPVELPGAAFAVLKPPIAVPTAAVFSSALLSRNTPPAIVADFLADPFGFGRNDLQAAAAGYANLKANAEANAKANVKAEAQKAEATQPGIATAKDRGGMAPQGIDQALELLARAFGSSRMTGSGSAVFAVAGKYADRCANSGPDAKASADKLDRLMATAAQDWSGRLCHSLPAHPLGDWSVD